MRESWRKGEKNVHLLPSLLAARKVAQAAAPAPGRQSVNRRSLPRRVRRAAVPCAAVGACGGGRCAARGDTVPLQTIKGPGLFRSGQLGIFLL